MAAVFVLKACPAGIGSTPWSQLALTAAASYAIGTAATCSLKQLVSERRPDQSDRRSFPSGHAMFAFAGAAMLHHEYGRWSPWVTIGGYGVAAAVAIDRLLSRRHYLHDVCAGAAIGTAATELSYWLKQKWLKSKNVDFSFHTTSMPSFSQSCRLISFSLNF